MVESTDGLTLCPWNSPFSILWSSVQTALPPRKNDNELNLLVFFQELDRRLEAAGHAFEWSDIKQDLKALQQTIIGEDGKHLAVRSRCLGTCGRVFQSVGVAFPPTGRAL